MAGLSSVCPMMRKLRSNFRMIMQRVTIFIAAALVAAALSASASADDKPAAKIETRNIEASVSIDDGLKAYPGLYDNLLAEGRRELTKLRAQADKARKEMPELFREGRKHSCERGYTQRSSIGRYVSVLRADYRDGLGAHPNHQTDTILWDADAKKRVSIRPFFKETADNGPTMTAMAAAIRAALVVEKKKRETYEANDSGLEAVKPSLLKIGAVALVPSTAAGKSAGLVAYFSPYMVGAYAEGDYTVFVPWTAFRQYLSPEGAGLFGGERPLADAEKD